MKGGNAMRLAVMLLVAWIGLMEYLNQVIHF